MKVNIGNSGNWQNNLNKSIAAFQKKSELILVPADENPRLGLNITAGYNTHGLCSRLNKIPD